MKNLSAKLAGLQCIGNRELLNRGKVAVICSVKCPGSLILRTYDLMSEIRDEDMTVISGFHSPMERECLNILVRGACGIVICYARSVPERISSQFRKAIAEGRLLLLSAFPRGQNRVTRSSSVERNRLVAELADVVFAPYASPGGMTEAICKEAAASGKPVFTFGGESNASLLAVGAKAIPLTDIASLLRSTHPSGTGGREPTYNLAAIRRDHPRAYERWTAEEEKRLLKLRDEGMTRREIARQLQRQPGAISSRLRKLELD